MRHCYPKLPQLIAVIFLTLAVSSAQAQTVLYVDADAQPSGDGTSWSTAFTHLQDALDEANANPNTAYEIWVAEGVYYPDEGDDGDHANDDRSETFAITHPDLALFGGFSGNESARDERDVDAHATVLSGDIAQDDVTNSDGVTAPAEDISGDNSFHVISISDAEPSTRIDGIWITAGNADGASSTDQQGGGMINAQSNMTLIDVVSAGNRAQNGGGLFNEGNFGVASPTLLNVTFSGNQASGAGAGLYNSGNLGESSPMVVNTVFSGNAVTDGAGGAMYNSAPNSGTSSPTIINSTFTNNTADGGTGIGRAKGGALYNNANGGVSEPQIVNSIFWGNTATDVGGEIYNLEGANPQISSSIVEGGVTGSKIGGDPNTDGGDILDQDPMFVDATGSDGVAGTSDDRLMVESGSPTVDSGDASALPQDTYDVDSDGDTSETLALGRAGSSRVQGDDVDVGAFEMAASTDTEMSSALPGDHGISDIYPNPFRSETQLTYSIPSTGHVQLTIHDILGRKVDTLVDTRQSAGERTVRFRADDRPAGIYLYRLKVGSRVQTGQMVHVR